jgi:hypothetical protein
MWGSWGYYTNYFTYIQSYGKANGYVELQILYTVKYWVKLWFCVTKSHNIIIYIFIELEFVELEFKTKEWNIIFINDELYL